MKTNVNITTNVNNEKFCILDGEDFVKIETDKKIKKYAKKLKISTDVLDLIVYNHNQLIDALNEDLSQIWKRLDTIENK